MYSQIHYKYSADRPLNSFARLKIEITSVSKENSLIEFEGTFAGVGKLKDFQAKLHDYESVPPIAQKLRPPPFGLREKI